MMNRECLDTFTQNPKMHWGEGSFFNALGFGAGLFSIMHSGVGGDLQKWTVLVYCIADYVQWWYLNGS